MKQPRWYLIGLCVLPAFGQPVVQVGRAFFRGSIVDYRVVNGRAVMQGDIDLGPVELMSENWVPDSSATKGGKDASYRTGTQFRWPNGVVPYTVDADVPNPTRISDAMGIWSANTPIKFVARSNEANYVRFIRQQNNGVCFSALGMTGGEQLVRVDDACGSGALTHEIGHALGMYHEQARSDRDFYVAVDYSALDRRRFGDLNMSQPNSTDFGGYDYGSMMHYTRFDGAKDRQLVDMETIPAGIPILEGGRPPSAGDFEVIRKLYGAPSPGITITSNPEGLSVVVDGETIVTPKVFSWAIGSTHTVDVPQIQGNGDPIRYAFGRWGDNGDKAHTIAVNSDVTVYSAHFIRQFKLTTGVTPGNGGTMSVSPASSDGYYADATALTFTATPANGFTFTGWTGTLSTTGEALTASPYHTLLTFSGANYTARFTATSALGTGIITIATDPPNLPVTVNGSRLPGPRKFIGSTANIGADTSISFGYGATRYVFQGWSDGGDISHTFSLPASGQSATVTAVYKLQYNVTVALFGGGTAAISPSSADGYWDAGTQLKITVTAPPAAVFTGWSGDLSGTDTTQTVTVKAPIWAQSNFQRPFAVLSTNVLNSANYLFTPVSPGEIITIFGLNIGPAQLTTLQLDSNKKVATVLAGSRVLFDGVAAPLVYTSQNQISAIVPYAVSGKTTTNVQVSLTGTNGVATVSTAAAIPVGTASPGLFTLNSAGSGQAAILNQDYSYNTPSTPAAKGSVVILYATGEGQTSPAGVDGSVAASTLPAPTQKVSVRVGGPPGIGKEAAIAYAGAAPGLVAGVLQINAVIPPDAPSGNVPIQVTVGSTSSGLTATVAIK